MAIASVVSVIGRGTGFLLFAIVARGRGSAGADAYALAINYLTLFLPIASLGLGDPMVRDVAKDRGLAARYVVNLGLLRLVSAVICYGLLATFAGGVFGYAEDTRQLVLLMGLSLIPESMGQIFQALFTAFEHQVYNAILIGFTSAANLGLAWGALHTGADLVTLAWIRLACASLGLVLSALLAARVVPAEEWSWSGLKPDLSWTLAKLAAALPFTLMVIFYTIEWRADLLILSAWAGQGDVAQYYAAQLVLVSFLLLLDAYRLAALPAMSRLAREDPQRLGALHDRSLWYLSVLVVPMAVGTAMLGQEVLSLFSPELRGGASTLIVLMVALVISFLNEPNGLIMIAGGHQRSLALLLGVSLAVNLLANLLLVPALGGLGAAVARVMSVTSFSIPNAVLVRRKIRPHRPLAGLPRALVSAALMALALGLLKALIPWWLAVLVSGGVYAAALLALRGVPAEDLGLLRQYRLLRSK